MDAFKLCIFMGKGEFAMIVVARNIYRNPLTSDQLQPAILRMTGCIPVTSRMLLSRYLYGQVVMATYTTVTM